VDCEQQVSLQHRLSFSKHSKRRGHSLQSQRLLLDQLKVKAPQSGSPTVQTERWAQSPVGTPISGAAQPHLSSSAREAWVVGMMCQKKVQEILAPCLSAHSWWLVEVQVGWTTLLVAPVLMAYLTWAPWCWMSVPVDQLKNHRYIEAVTRAALESEVEVLATVELAPGL
jgi:hypothetical protein